MNAPRLSRVLEPEVMDTEEEARDYDAMDHREVNARFCDDLLAFVAAAGKPRSRRVIDVGAGTALIPIELCGRAPRMTIEAIDLAEHMLAVGRVNVAKAGLSDRIALRRLDAKRTGLPDGAFDAAISNSIVHHIPEPEEVLREMWRLVAPGGILFVRDLLRPATDAEVRTLVDTYAAPTPGASAELAAREGRQRALFEASLRAALTLDEVQGLVARLGIDPGAVRQTSDRHWTLGAVKP